MSTSSLSSPLQLGRYALSHRVVMAPLTRMRAALPGNVPTELNAAYYGQRATKGGLLITEASQVSPFGQGYPATPGIHSPEQVAGWRKVTQAVHERGGLIFLQLWHVGRISHRLLQPDGVLPVAPSAVAPAGMALTPDWKQVPYEAPRALETSEIAGIVEDFRAGARNALAAGFDGVEIHGANGYLLEQFLQTRTNHRSDAYGGSIENRYRLLGEVAKAVVDVWGADRVGVRLSPFGNANDSGEADPLPLYGHAIRELGKLGLGYLHLIESRDPADADRPTLATDAQRPLWPGVVILAGGFDGASGERVVLNGQADAVAYGRMFIANPDLPERLMHHAALNPADRSTFYGGGEKGYTDYPTLAELQAAE
jgi:N-ethylmaleimide reductase